MWTEGLARERWRQQYKTEWGGDESSAAYDTLGVTWHKSSDEISFEGS